MYKFQSCKDQLSDLVVISFYVPKKNQDKIKIITTRFVDESSHRLVFPMSSTRQRFKNTYHSSYSQVLIQESQKMKESEDLMSYL